MLLGHHDPKLKGEGGFHEIAISGWISVLDPSSPAVTPFTLLHSLCAGPFCVSKGPSFYTCFPWDFTSSIQSCNQCQSNMSQWIPSFCLLCSANSSGEQPSPPGAPSGFLGESEVTDMPLSLLHMSVREWVCVFPSTFPLLFLQFFRESCGPSATPELQRSVDTTTAKQASPEDLVLTDIMGTKVGREWGLATNQNKHKAITDP